MLHTYDGTDCSLTHIIADSIVDGVAKHCLSQAADGHPITRWWFCTLLPSISVLYCLIELLPSHRNEECCQQVCQVQRP